MNCAFSMVFWGAVSFQKNLCTHRGEKKEISLDMRPSTLYLWFAVLPSTQVSCPKSRQCERLCRRPCDARFEFCCLVTEGRGKYD